MTTLTILFTESRLCAVWWTVEEAGFNGCTVPAALIRVVENVKIVENVCKKVWQHPCLLGEHLAR